MSGERFQIGDTNESYESPFQQIDVADAHRSGQNTTAGIPSTRSFTEIGEGEVSVKKNSLSLSVPVNFSLFGSKYSIKDYTNYNSGILRRNYSVVAADGSSLRMDIIIRPVRKLNSDLQPQVSFKIESVNATNRIGTSLILDPKRAFNTKETDNLQRVINNIKNTQIERFMVALPSFDSLGPINPKSILTNPKILLRRILNRKGFQNVSQLGELETPEISMEASTVDKVLSGAACIGSGVVTIGSAAGGPVGVLMTAARAAGTVKTCYDAYNKIFTSDTPAQKTTGIDCPPGYYEDKDPSTNTWVCKPSQRGLPPTESCPSGQSWKVVDHMWTCVPDSSPVPNSFPTYTLPRTYITAAVPPEKIRWVQTTLRFANGESALDMDGIKGPKTRDAIKRFQEGFKLLANGLINQETTNALIQLGLNHIARQSKIVVDGKMGPMTISEIRSFQSTHDSGPVDGIVGPITRAAIVKELLLTVPVVIIREMNEGWY